MASSPAVTLFCFAHAGAVASSYARFLRFMPPSVELVPVELPGHGRRSNEPLETTMAGVLAQVKKSVHVDERRPFALFGHSTGALVAFELAHQLEAEGGASPLVLFASSAHPPSFTRQQTELALTDRELRAQLGRFSGTPEHALQSDELMELVLPVFRADLRVAHGYLRSTESPLACPIHAFAGTDDTVDLHALSGWRDHTTADFELSVLPGNHFYLHAQSAELCALIGRTLTRRMSELRAGHRRALATSRVEHDVDRPVGASTSSDA